MMAGAKETKMKSRVLQSLAALLTVLPLACHRTVSPAPETSVYESREVENPRVPVSVAWDAATLEQDRVRLTARIDRRVELIEPLEVSIRVPEGARLVKGEERFFVPAGAPVEVLALPIEVAFEKIPEGDLILVADVQTRAYGVHAEAVYRFGRPEPTGPRPTPSGPAIEIGGRKIGKAIEGKVPPKDISPIEPDPDGTL